MSDAAHTARMPIRPASLDSTGDRHDGIRRQNHRERPLHRERPFHRESRPTAAGVTRRQPRTTAADGSAVVGCGSSVNDRSRPSPATSGGQLSTDTPTVTSNGPDDGRRLVVVPAADGAIDYVAEPNPLLTVGTSNIVGTNRTETAARETAARQRSPLRGHKIGGQGA